MLKGFRGSARPAPGSQLDTVTRDYLSAAAERVAAVRLAYAVKAIDYALDNVRGPGRRRAVDALLDARNALTGGGR